jgi:hypothetical protein
MINGYDSQSYVSLILFFVAMLYTTFRTGSQGDKLGLGGDSVIMSEPSAPIDGGEKGTQNVWDDEEDQVAYNYR